VLKDFSLGAFVASVLCVILPRFTLRQSDSGYPKGLKGDAIPIEARINEVADVFGAY
jgi:HD domain